jgi:hypothetical protein
MRFDLGFQHRRDRRADRLFERADGIAHGVHDMVALLLEATEVLALDQVEVGEGDGELVAVTAAPDRA